MFPRPATLYMNAHLVWWLGTYSIHSTGQLLRKQALIKADQELQDNGNFGSRYTE